MEYWFTRLMCLIVVTAFLLVTEGAPGATVDLGKGFSDHGVATPASNHRGIVCTVDGQGRDVVLVWLFDNRGGYALLWIDAETGKSEEFPTPFPPGGDCPYSSILSTGNKYSTHFNSHFCEFDPAKRAFTFVHETTPGMAMGMTEDDAGLIWSVSYPNSGVCSFNPATREFKDYGSVHKENWAQYQRPVASDDTGWLYFGIGNTASQIIAFDPKTATAKPILADAERIIGSGYVYRDLNGKVYGQNGDGRQWFELYQGEAKRIPKPEKQAPKPIITSSQGLFHNTFPDGKIARAVDLIDHVLVVEDPKTKETKRLPFDYHSEGAHIMGVAAAPDGTICGGTAFPFRFFSYDPGTDKWINREAYGQWNTIARQGDHFFAGGYGGGFLLEWDPAQPWVTTVQGKAGCNPLFLTECEPDIHRPHRLLAHPDGKTLILAGTPGYGYTGGGLLFWDRETKQRVLLKHTDIIPEHSTMSLAPLADGKLLGGTTIAAGTGGEVKAKEAELYLMDMATKKLDWHEVVFPGAHGYTDLCAGPKGLVFGFADGVRFFVFDPAARKVVYQKDVSAEFGGTSGGQGPRVFVLGPNNDYLIILGKCLARLNPETFAITKVADSPASISVGGDYLNGRLYFAGGSHLYSYKLPEK